MHATTRNRKMVGQKNTVFQCLCCSGSQKNNRHFAHHCAKTYRMCKILSNFSEIELNVIALETMLKTSTCHFLTKSQEIKLLTFLAINLMKKSGTNNNNGVKGARNQGNYGNREP